MAEKIAQHTHCNICGKAIPVSELHCSEECKQKFENMLRKRRRYTYIIYITMAFIIVLFLYASATQ